jgi:ATP-binding cassette, subfamily B, bacterial
MLKSVGLFARHLRGKKGLLAAVFFLGLAGSAVALATPLLGKAFIDAVTERGDFSIVPRIALALLGLAFADLLLGTVTRVVHAKLSADVLMAIRERIFSHCLNSPLASLERFRHGDLLSRFGADVSQIQTLLVDGALGFLQNIIFLLVAASILFHLSPELALWSFLGIFVALAVTAAFRGPIEKGTRGIREVMAGISHFLAERLGALRAVRLHGTQQEEQHRYIQHNAGLVRRMLRFQALDAAATGLPGIMLTASLAYIYFLGGGLLERGEITLGTFVAFVLYQSRLFGPARGLLGLVRNIQEVRVSLDRVAEVLGEEETGAVPYDGRQKGEGIRLENVSFAYPDNPPVLSGVSLTIAPGQKVAIFGTSGAGKSTLVQLLFGLRLPAQGEVCSGRGKLGYAGNEPFLLHATVEENLRYGNPRADNDELVEAARLAAAHDFIESLPQGYQTVIGGRGQSLSDGQRQRLGLARLILNQPDILVLDEAFSALDPETACLVQGNLWDLFHDRIILAITHRLDDLHVFDHLYLLRDGKLQQVQEGALRVALGAALKASAMPEADCPGRGLAEEPKRVFA